MHRFKYSLVVSFMFSYFFSSNQFNVDWMKNRVLSKLKRKRVVISIVPSGNIHWKSISWILKEIYFNSKYLIHKYSLRKLMGPSACLAFSHTSINIFNWSIIEISFLEKNEPKEKELCNEQTDHWSITQTRIIYINIKWSSFQFTIFALECFFCFAIYAKIFISIQYSFFRHIFHTMVIVQPSQPGYKRKLLRTKMKQNTNTCI